MLEWVKRAQGLPCDYPVDASRTCESVGSQLLTQDETSQGQPDIIRSRRLLPPWTRRTLQAENATLPAGRGTICRYNSIPLHSQILWVVDTDEKGDGQRELHKAAEEVFGVFSECRDTMVARLPGRRPSDQQCRRPPRIGRSGSWWKAPLWLGCEGGEDA